MLRIVRASALLIGALVLVSWWLTRPQALTADDLPQHEPDSVAGQAVFWAGGCASCHASPVEGKRAKGEAKLRLGGGAELDTGYGVFRVPNISPHETAGIGGWSMLEFVNAMQRGVSPRGRHYYPSFPYTSYARMKIEDVMDLKAFLDTLPAVEGGAGDHGLAFPWNIRRGIGLWKRRYLTQQNIVELDSVEPAVRRGQALVEGAGHCGECHTPRDRFGGMLADRWLGGAPNPEGRGRVPNITPGGKNLADWSQSDISFYLESGFTPDFDTAGGSMVAVQENMAQLTKSDRDAIAAYLKSIPAIE
ncbi:MAG: c-type cytochrome [Woeseiaceae bacterium]|nr:c-type cytochrome [Woeseiaceae bacterium]NIP21961.1 c-type cytochrome [Woeseiaceae bacterium]NIS91085.1 c-type cytochrome [Woeseiaceae bacterium]